LSRVAWLLAAALAAAPSSRAQETPFESDMTRMLGMTPEPSGERIDRWRVMVLGIARGSANHQGGPSGKGAIESTNWNMAMAQRDLGPGRLTLMLMSSLEPATVPRRGSPELFQTGETYKRAPLVDRQHPHDFFMNASATFRAALGGSGAAWAQAALRGDPALGPTAFMHRASAGENPVAPLGHHWQDSTHITNNVITLGGGWKRVAFEASAFHGREPDERRWDIDGGRIDSYAARARVELAGGWSAQVSHGFLKHPEALVERDARRTTVSLHYGARGDRPVAATLLWGHNDEGPGSSDASLAEIAWQLTARDQVYARAESVEKDLDLLASKSRHVEPPSIREATTLIHQLTLGYLRDFASKEGLKAGVGADATVYGFASQLELFYGDFPVSARAYLRLRWGRPHAAGAHHHGGSRQFNPRPSPSGARAPRPSAAR
jgi:hypothetical protein